MRIDSNSICTIINSKDFKEFQIEHTKRGIDLMKEKNINLEKLDKCLDKIDFFTLSGFRSLVFSETSKNNLEDYSVPKEIRLDVLKSLPNRKDTIQIDKQNCLKYIKTDEYIRGIFCFRKDILVEGEKVTTNNYIHTNYFSIDLDNGEILVDERFTYDNSPIDKKLFIERFFSRFMVVVTYLELTEVSLKFVGSILSKKRKNHIGITNLSRYDIIYVNSNWNTRTINLNTINVRGHYRLQPYGVGRSKFKYIYIEPFQKGLVRRLSQKELV